MKNIFKMFVNRYEFSVFGLYLYAEITVDFLDTEIDLRVCVYMSFINKTM